MSTYFNRGFAIGLVMEHLKQCSETIAKLELEPELEEECKKVLEKTERYVLRQFDKANQTDSHPPSDR